MIERYILELRTKCQNYVQCLGGGDNVGHCLIYNKLNAMLQCEQ